MGGQARNGLTSDDPLVADFIARHGVRRFERGATGDVLNLKTDLISRGYEVEMGRFGETFRVRAPGPDARTQTLSADELLALYDTLRVAEGLEPLRVRR